MYTYFSRTVITLNRLLLLHVDMKKSTKKDFRKLYLCKINTILNKNLDLFEALQDESLPLTALAYIKVEYFESIANFFPSQTLALVELLGTTCFHASRQMNTLSEQMILLEKANALFDVAYIYLPITHIHSKSSFLGQSSMVKIALAKELVQLNDELSAKHLRIRAQAIMRINSAETLQRELLETDVFIEAA